MTEERKFKQNYDPSYNGTRCKKDYPNSLTKPSMSMTVRELMEKHTRGLGLGVSAKEEMYLDEQGLEVPKVTDLTDIQERRENLMEKQKELREKAKEEIKLKKEKDLEIEKSKKEKPKKEETIEQNKEE